MLATAYVVNVSLAGGIGQTLVCISKVIIPLACIWFPDEVAHWPGRYLQLIAGPSPAWLVRLIGWTMLSMPLWLPVLIWLARPLCG